MSASAMTGPRVTTGAVQVADVLRTAESVVLLAHVHPDADSLGSAFALGLALQAAGTTVAVAFDQPAETPESLRELPGAHLLVREPDPAPDVVVTMDVASPARLGALRALLESAATSVVIDHHVSNPGFGAVNWVDGGAEATVVLVAQLIDELDLPMTRDIAVNLYAGLATDTVNFRFASQEAHSLAARLVGLGVCPAEVLAPIFDSHPFAWLGMLGTVLANAELYRSAARGAGLVAVPIRRSDAVGLRQEELDSVIDIVRTAQEADVAAVLKQTADTQWQVSLRSRNGLDVGRVATALGGGGHPRAAGYSFDGSYAELLAQLVPALDAAVPESA